MVASIIVKLLLELVHWMVFAAYPNARPLCDEHVIGNFHIDWQSYAVSDDIEKVAKFYERDQNASFQPDPDTGGRMLRAPSDPDIVMTLITVDKAENIPSCDTKPKKSKGEKTVIMIGKAIRQKK
jgi:hypothetical protein